MESKLEQGKVALLCAFGILIFTLWSNVGAYAQNTTAAAGNSTTATSSQHCRNHLQTQNNMLQK